MHKVVTQAVSETKRHDLILQYLRKDKYKNYQRKSSKSALVTNEDATVNTWASFC